MHFGYCWTGNAFHLQVCDSVANTVMGRNLGLQHCPLLTFRAVCSDLLPRLPGGSRLWDTGVFTLPQHKQTQSLSSPPPIFPHVPDKGIAPLKTHKESKYYHYHQTGIPCLNVFQAQGKVALYELALLCLVDSLRVVLQPKTIEIHKSKNAPHWAWLMHYCSSVSQRDKSSSFHRFSHVTRK